MFVGPEVASLLVRLDKRVVVTATHLPFRILAVHPSQKPTDGVEVFHRFHPRNAEAIPLIIDVCYVLNPV